MRQRYRDGQEGHSDVVDILLEAGADVHQATTEDGDVPLGIAAQNGHTETVQRLLEAGANVNHQNKVEVFGCQNQHTFSYVHLCTRHAHKCQFC
ncbi:Ankyrin repeat domain-containing protein 17, partial [Geodia barretti]